VDAAPGGHEGRRYSTRYCSRLGYLNSGRSLLLVQQPKRYWRSALADSVRQLVSQIPVDSGRIWAWDQCHWKLYEILLPTIYRTSKTDSVCDLGVRFIAHCSWTSNWTRTWIAFGLHLGDSNWINLGPPSWLGKFCWTSSTPLHAPIMVVCMGVMSSSMRLWYWFHSNGLCFGARYQSSLWAQRNNHFHVIGG
jgi:hypothetical protein